MGEDKGSLIKQRPCAEAKESKNFILYFQWAINVQPLPRKPGCIEPNLIVTNVPLSSFPCVAEQMSRAVGHPLASADQLSWPPRLLQRGCCRGSPGAVPALLTSLGSSQHLPGHQHSPARGTGGKPAAAPPEPGQESQPAAGSWKQPGCVFSEG